jgi:hypothetical protein
MGYASVDLVFRHPDQFSRISYVDDNSCLLVSSLPLLILLDVLASRYLDISMLRNDCTEPTQ